MILLALSVLALQQAQQPDYADQPFVIERQEQVFRYEADGTGTRELFIRVRIQSDAALQAFGQLSLPYSSANQDLTIDSVRVLKAGGGSVLAPAGAVQDLNGPLAADAPMYSDIRMKVITVPSLRLGDTLQYHVTWRTRTAFAPNQFWEMVGFPQDGIVLDERLALTLPRGTPVSVRTVGVPEPVTADSAGRRWWRWHSQNLTVDTIAQRRYPLLPMSHVVQFTSFHDWTEVGRWYAGLEREREVVTPAIRTTADSLVRGASSLRDSVAAIYEFVSTHFRYVSLSFGVGRYQPHAAAEVLANQYGDCKDKHTLLAALLKSVGIASAPVLASSGTAIDSAAPSPGQFDHVITWVPAGRDTFWLDATTEVGPFRYLLPTLRGEAVLVMPIQGAARLARTPAELPYAPFQHIRMDGTLDTAGSLALVWRDTLRGDDEVVMRAVFRQIPKTRPDFYGAGLARSIGLAGTGSALRGGEPTDLREPFMLEFHLQRPQVDWHGGNAGWLTLPMLPMELPEPDSAHPDSMLIPAGEFSEALLVRLPDNVTATLPENDDVRTEFGDYHSSYHTEGHVLMVERVLHRHFQLMPPSRAAAYTTFKVAVTDSQPSSILLRRLPAVQTVDGRVVSIPAEAVQLYGQAVELMRNRDYVSAVPLLRRVIVAVPRHPQAYGELGFALMNMGRYSEAEDNFRRQLEITPDDRYANGNLGYTLWREHKNAEARTTFLRQIALVPDDSHAHAELGGLAIDLHDDSLAMAELTRARALDTADASLVFQMARAHLAAHRVDAAMADFDSAIAMQPGALMLNNAAYELSLAGERLDRAESYARAAVDAAAARLPTSMDSLVAVQYGDVFSLSSYWDTLAWILFGRGELAEAERYARAAWALSQRRALGEHLARILQRTGHNDEAVRVYAMAADGRAIPAAGIGHAPDPEPPAAASAQQTARLAGLELRTIRAPARVPSEVNGDVVVLVAANGSISAAKSLAGLALKGAEHALVGVKAGAAMPISDTQRIVRRGLLTCVPGSGCTLVLSSAEDALMAVSRDRVSGK